MISKRYFFFKNLFFQLKTEIGQVLGIITAESHNFQITSQGAKTSKVFEFIELRQGEDNTLL